METHYTKNEALKIIRSIIKNGGTFLTSHLKQQMDKRNFDIQDVLNCINNGYIYDNPEPHPRTNKWIYKIKGEKIDGEKLEVVVAVYKEKNMVAIITGIAE